MSTTVTAAGGGTNVSKESAFTVGVNIGFWFDLFGVGVALTPGNAGGNTLIDMEQLEDGNLQISSNSIRVDIDAPLKINWFKGRAKPRLSLGYASLIGHKIHKEDGETTPTTEGGKGDEYFVGMTGALHGGIASVSAGVSWMDFTDTLDVDGTTLQVKGVGIEARFMVAGWYPVFLKNIHTRDINPGPAREVCVDQTSCEYTLGGYRCSSAPKCF